MCQEVLGAVPPGCSLGDIFSPSRDRAILLRGTREPRRKRNPSMVQFPRRTAPADRYSRLTKKVACFPVEPVERPKSVNLQPGRARLHGGSDQLGKNLEWEIGKWHLAAGVAHRVQSPLFVADAGILSLNRRAPVLLSSILYLPTTHDGPVKPELLALAATPSPPGWLRGCLLTGLGHLVK